MTRMLRRPSGVKLARLPIGLALPALVNPEPLGGFLPYPCLKGPGRLLHEGVGVGLLVARLLGDVHGPDVEVVGVAGGG